MTQFTYQIGNDNGNSEHAMIINNTLILQPNVNAEVEDIPWTEDQTPESFIKNLQDNLIVTVKSPSAQNGMYYVGKFALNSGEVVNNLQVGIDIKSNVDLPVINTLAQIAAKAVQDYYSSIRKVPVTLDVLVDMTTALPITQYTKETAGTFEAKFMQDRHEVIVHLGRNEVNVFIEFDFVKVVPEATPVTFSIQRDLKNDWRTDEIFDDFVEKYKSDLPINFSGSYFRDKRVLHVDIGDGTTEYPVTEGNNFLHQFVYGSNHGAGHAIEEALEEFNRQIFIPDSPRQFLSDVIKNPKHKYYERAMNVLQKPIEKQAKQIVKNIKQQLVKTRNEIDVIAVYGGGSILLRNYLEPMIEEVCKERAIKLLYVPAAYANVLNVEGLDIFCRSKIFESLKSKNGKFPRRNGE
jgi:plasmid segregation protein ParM